MNRTNRYLRSDPENRYVGSTFFDKGIDAHIDSALRGGVSVSPTNRLINSLSFPDSNVWLAPAAPEHVHAAIARRWWEQQAGMIGFSRLTQLGFLRLMTTAAVMDGKPLTIAAAWRVTFVSEPPEVEKRFREKASGRTASPKLWADAWLLAPAQEAEGVLVTFDQALASRGAYCLLTK